jgi:TolA-binding protein
MEFHPGTVSPATSYANSTSWVHQARALVTHWPPPYVADADPYEFGVFKSPRAEAYCSGDARPPYVPRHTDEELTQLLRRHAFVIVRGPSRAGKSRSAFEVASAVLPNWRLVAPRDGNTLHALSELERPLTKEPMLVWLDDLERYFEAGALNASLIRRLTRSPSSDRVLATIRLSEHSRFRQLSGSLGRTVREVLGCARAITLSAAFDNPTERAAIARLYPGESFIGGLGEHLAAAPELALKFEEGIEQCPEGVALVKAAVDWRRAGLSRPIVRSELRLLWEAYFEGLQPLMSSSEKAFNRGLAWATKLEGRTAALLVRAPEQTDEAYVASDYLLELVEQQRPCLERDKTWTFVLARATAGEAVKVGIAAYTRGNIQFVGDAIMQAIEASASDGVPEIACEFLETLASEQASRRDPQANLDLGAAAEKALDATMSLALGAITGTPISEGALAAYRAALLSGDQSLASRAAMHLGGLLERKQDSAAAIRVYRFVQLYKHPTYAPQATIRLGSLLRREGNIKGAQAAFEEVINSGPLEAAAEARLRLGSLLRREGNIKGAQAAFEEVINSGPLEAAAEAAVQLTLLSAERDGRIDIHAIYEQISSMGDSEGKLRLMTDLGLLLAKQGDAVRAQLAFEHVVASGHAVHAPRAAN